MEVIGIYPPRESTNDDVIQYLLNEGKAKKLGLIIGREKQQNIPNKEDNWIWASGNVEGDPIIINDRVHLKLDFNEQETLSKLECFFDTVIIDFSSIKFIQNAWEHSNFGCTHLLKPLKTSKLITEVFNNMTSYYDTDFQSNVIEKAYINNNGTLNLPFKCMQDKGEHLRQTEIALESLKERLRSQFETVEIKDGDYAKRENLDPPNYGYHLSAVKKISYLILTGPKDYEHKTINKIHHRKYQKLWGINAGLLHEKKLFIKA